MERSRSGLKLIAGGTGFLAVAAFVDVARLVDLHTYSEFDAAYAMSVLAWSVAAAGWWTWSTSLDESHRPPLTWRTAFRILAGAGALFGVSQLVLAISGAVHGESAYFLAVWSLATVGYFLVAGGWWTWGEGIAEMHASSERTLVGAEAPRRTA